MGRILAFELDEQAQHKGNHLPLKAFSTIARIENTMPAMMMFHCLAD